MYGSWLGTVFAGVIVIAILIALSVLASPLIAVILALLVAALAAFLFVGARARQAGDGSATSGPADRSAYRGGPRPSPPGGGAPVSGEGHAHGGETAGTARSDG